MIPNLSMFPGMQLKVLLCVMRNSRPSHVYENAELKDIETVMSGTRLPGAAVTPDGLTLPGLLSSFCHGIENTQTVKSTIVLLFQCRI